MEKSRREVLRGAGIIMENKTITVDYYRRTEVAEKYEGLRYGDDAGRYMHQREVHILLEELSPLKGSNILDVGVGTGRLAIEFARRGAQVLGLDISKTMLKTLKIKMKSYRDPLDVEVVLGDAEHLPFKDHAVSGVVSAYTVNHIPNYEQVLKEMCRISSDRIIVIVTYLVSVLAPLPLVINPLRRLLNKLPVYSKYFWPNEITEVLKDERFAPRQRGIYLVPPKIVSFILLPRSLIRFFEYIDPIMESLLRKVYAVQVTIGYRQGALLSH